MSRNITNAYLLGRSPAATRHDQLVTAMRERGSTGVVATFGPVVAAIGHELSDDALADLTTTSPTTVIAAQSFEGSAAQATAYAGGREVATAILGHAVWTALAEQFNAMLVADPERAEANGWQPMEVPEDRLHGIEWWVEHGFGIGPDDLEAMVADGADPEAGLVALLDATGVSEYLAMLVPEMITPSEAALSPDAVTRL